MSNRQIKQRVGAENLLINCIGVKLGESIAIIKELDGIDYYDEAAPNFVENVAKEMGLTVFSLRAPMLLGPENITDAMLRTINSADHTIFFSRIGDQIRFSNLRGALRRCAMR